MSSSLLVMCRRLLRTGGDVQRDVPGAGEGLGHQCHHPPVAVRRGHSQCGHVLSVTIWILEIKLAFLILNKFFVDF